MSEFGFPAIVFLSLNNRTSIALDNHTDPDFESLVKLQPPKLGEWTRIEISQEEKNGKCFLSFSVGGKEVGRREVDYPGEITDVKICFGPWVNDVWPAQPGFIKGLVVLDKQ